MRMDDQYVSWQGAISDVLSTTFPAPVRKKKEGVAPRVMDSSL